MKPFSTGLETKVFGSVVLVQKQDPGAVKSSERPTTNGHTLNDPEANCIVIQIMVRP